MTINRIMKAAVDLWNEGGPYNISHRSISEQINRSPSTIAGAHTVTQLRTLAAERILADCTPDTQTVANTSTQQLEAIAYMRRHDK